MTGHTFSTHVCATHEEMAATESGVHAIIEGLGRNIVEHLGDVELGRSVRVFAHDAEGRVVGGAVSHVFGGWVYISLLWVAPSLRGRGVGTELMRRLEEEAARQGCVHAHLDTYSFEARPFYEKLGYRVFAALDDYPRGHQKYFLRKDLRS